MVGRFRTSDYRYMCSVFVRARGLGVVCANTLTDFVPQPACVTAVDASPAVVSLILLY